MMVDEEGDGEQGRAEREEGRVTTGGRGTGILQGRGTTVGEGAEGSGKGQHGLASASSSQSWPIAMPILRSGMP